MPYPTARYPVNASRLLTSRPVDAPWCLWSTRSCRWPRALGPAEHKAAETGRADSARGALGSTPFPPLPPGPATRDSAAGAAPRRANAPRERRQPRRVPAPPSAPRLLRGGGDAASPTPCSSTTRAALLPPGGAGAAPGTPRAWPRPRVLKLRRASPHLRARRSWATNATPPTARAAVCGASGWPRPLRTACSAAEARGQRH